MSWSVEARVGPSEEWPSARVSLDRADLERICPRESRVILELDSRLWRGEALVDVERLRRPDRQEKEDTDSGD